MYIFLVRCRRHVSSSPFSSTFRIVLSTKSRSGLEANVLEAFFPFDPYNLRDSAVHITNYVEWTPSEDGVPDIMDDGIDR